MILSNSLGFRPLYTDSFNCSTKIKTLGPSGDTGRFSGSLEGEGDFSCGFDTVSTDFCGDTVGSCGVTGVTGVTGITCGCKCTTCCCCGGTT